MATTQIENRGSFKWIILLALAVAGALALGTLLKAPFSLHATNSHADQYNAIGIRHRIKDNLCEEVLCYHCANRTIKLLCRIKPDLWGGLVVGYSGALQIIDLDSDQFTIITGWAAPWAYWQRVIARDACIQILISP